MSGTLFRTGFRNSLGQVRHIRTAPAVGTVSEVYQQIERDLGVLAPQVALHSPAPEHLAASWMMVRESLVADGLVDRTTKEAVAAIVALGNGCQYCADLHTATLDALGEARQTDDPGYDHAVRAVADWARASRLRGTAGTGLRDFPVPADHLPELIGVVVAGQYLTRMAGVFLPASAKGLPGRHLLRAATARHAPGASVNLLPFAPLPDDFGWAAGNPAIHSAFASAAAVIDAGGARSVPDAVREIVLAELSEWDGRLRGPDRGWVGDLVAGLPFTQRPVARLALLTALAGGQVDQSVIDEFRRLDPADRSLIEVTAWASLAAARRVGGWTWAAAARRVEPERVRFPEPVGG